MCSLKQAQILHKIITNYNLETNNNLKTNYSMYIRGCLEDIRNRKVADIGNLRDHYLMVAMLRRAPTYFTRSLKSAATAALFNQSVKEHIHNFRSPSQPNLNWDAVHELYLTLEIW